MGVVGRNRDIYLFLRESSPIAFFLDMGQGGAQWTKLRSFGQWRLNCGWGCISQLTRVGVVGEISRVCPPYFSTQARSWHYLTLCVEQLSDVHCGHDAGMVLNQRTNGLDVVNCKAARQ